VHGSESRKATDAGPFGLMRLFSRILLATGGAVLALHVLVGSFTGLTAGRMPVLLGLDGTLLVLAFLVAELSEGARLRGRRQPPGVVFLLVGLYVVFLCAETGGSASPWFLALLVTVVFSALVMPGHFCLLLTAVLAAGHAATAWLYPNGILRQGLDGLLQALKTGRVMDVDEIATLATHTTFLFVGAWVAWRMSQELRQKVTTLQDHATRDPLTSLPNRRAFMDRLRRELGRAERYAWPISVLVVDLDHFKRINDLHGHAFGDAVLSQASRILRDGVGPVDHLARVGGEEFAVAAVAAEPNHGAELAQRIVRLFRDHPWHEMREGLSVTCSVGVATMDTSRASQDADAAISQALDEADRLLYQVKESGRNNYRVATPATAHPARSS
jgi:diguanylate cyclase (GGDEF)-like protein